MRTLMPWQVRPSASQPQALKITADRGRLVVAGPGYRVARKVKGAVLHEPRKGRAVRPGVAWLSLTLESLRALRQAAGVSSETFASWCAPDVLQWAKAAGRAERAVTELHQRMEQGWRIEFPWHDGSGAARPPFEHQRIMATVAVSLDGAAFLCEMGTGKTRAAVEAMSHLLRADQLDHVLVVCPKGVMPTWQRECATWATDLSTVVLQGSVKARAQSLDDITTGATLCQYPQVIILNYDVLYLLEGALRRLCKGRRVGLLLDEMHRVRNPNAKVTKAAMRTAIDARWRLGLTGTPILQGAHDIWSQWYVVDQGLTFGANWVQFRAEFFEMGEVDRSINPLDGTLDEIGMRLRRRGLRFRKVDCLDLPPKIYEVQEIELTPSQRKAYREMEEELIARLEEMEHEATATAANQLVLILRLTQITSGFVGDDEGRLHRFTPNPKLDALEELVKEQITDQQMLVWARYREDIRAIGERLAAFAPLVIDGSTKPGDRDVAQAEFQAGRCRLLVANPAAGGVGLNLQAASLAVYYSQGYSLEHRLQSEDRCHRAGSERHNKVTYVDLVAKDTIDAVVRDALAAKKDVADMVVDLKRALGLGG